MIYIGIDPGKNGGLAVITDTEAYTVPLTRENLLYHIGIHKGARCVLEKVGAMPGQGVVSMFTFGEGYGYIQGVLEAHKIPYELVHPKKWKKEFSITQDKNLSIDVAKRLFPCVSLKATPRCKKDHDGMAEALLMAEYGRRHI